VASHAVGTPGQRGEIAVQQPSRQFGCPRRQLHRAEVRGQPQHLCAKRPLLWTCTEPATQRSIKGFPAAMLPALALRALRSRRLSGKDQIVFPVEPGFLRIVSRALEWGATPKAKQGRRETNPLITDVGTTKRETYECRTRKSLRWRRERQTATRSTSTQSSRWSPEARSSEHRRRHLQRAHGSQLSRRSWQR
jgi:hypothetical protein